MWMFVKVFQGMQRKSCSTSWLLLWFWFTWEPCLPSPWKRASSCREDELKYLKPYLCCNFPHENTTTSEAVYPGSYLGRSGVDQLVLGKGFMLFWPSLLCVIMYSIDISIEEQLAALSKIFQLPFSRWEELGAYKGDKSQSPRCTKES